MKKTTIITLISFIILLFIIIFNYSYIFFEEYLKLFKESGDVTEYYNKGKNQGKIISITKGTIVKKVNFLNGIRNGWSTDYYSNGKIKYMLSYKNNVSNGPEYQYYRNGKLNYKAFQKNGKRFGSFFLYLENGQLDSYAAFDIKGESFCLFEYDRSGGLIDTKGLFLSPFIFSIDEKTKSIALLKFNENYNNIKDLYITVATPPDFHVNVNAIINGVHYSNLVVQNNCVIIPNVFISKGTYNIFIQGHLKDKSYKDISGMNIERKIYKIE